MQTVRPGLLVGGGGWDVTSAAAAVQAGGEAPCHEGDPRPYSL